MEGIIGIKACSKNLSQRRRITKIRLNPALLHRCDNCVAVGGKERHYQVTDLIAVTASFRLERALGDQVACSRNTGGFEEVCVREQAGQSQQAGGGWKDLPLPHTIRRIDLCRFLTVRVNSRTLLPASVDCR